MKAIILFDGVCHLCNGGVQWIIKRDPQAFFYFCSLQSEKGRSLQKQYRIDPDLDSIILLLEGRVYLKSDAVLQIFKHLKGMYWFFSFPLCLPKSFRDRLYDAVAKRRYKWFGRSDVCMVPTRELKNRFLE